MPFVTPSLLSLIVERSGGEPFATVPESASGLEPFCALYTPACLPLVERAIEDGDLRVTWLPHRFPSFKRIPVTDIETIGDPTQFFFNVNSAADLGRAEEMGRAGRSRWGGTQEYP
jgi:molybdopterin-guanine dinucleotide biosynthesis protein A